MPTKYVRTSATAWEAHDEIILPRGRPAVPFSTLTRGEVDGLGRTFVGVSTAGVEHWLPYRAVPRPSWFEDTCERFDMRFPYPDLDLGPYDTIGAP